MRAAVARLLNAAADRVRHPREPVSDGGRMLAWDWGRTGKGPLDRGAALKIDVVYQCVNVLSQSLAVMPLKLLRAGDGTRLPERAHALYEAMALAPNPEMTAYAFKQAMQANASLRGNAYAQVLRDAGGRAVGLYPLHPDRVRVLRSEQSKRIVYEWTPAEKGAEPVALPASEVVHVRAMTLDGLVGLNPLEYQAATMRLSESAAGNATRAYDNDATPGGVIEGENEMSEEAYRRLKDAWNNPADRGKTKILEQGFSYKAIGLTAKDSQFLEQRRYQKEQIAALYRVPLYMLNDLERATFSNIEHQGQDFIRHCMNAWMVNWEQELRTKLLTPEERRRGLYFHFNAEAFLRGDIKTRFDAYNIGIQNGVISPNEARAKEDMNPYEGGDQHMANGNMVPVGQQPDKPNE